MDYKTKATSRKELREFAKILRKLFDIPQTGAFPVLEVLDCLCDVFRGCTYAILDDSEFPTNTMARCTLEVMSRCLKKLNQMRLYALVSLSLK